MMPTSLNLAVVGEAVRSCWPLDLCDKTKNPDELNVQSGTSFATPIAASLATFLLMFAQTHLTRHEADKLRKFEHMKAVIEGVCAASVAKGHKAPEYAYLTLHLKPDNLFGRDLEEIKRVISDALKGRG